MNKANECSCPSGDGSLVHPCPAHPAVEQAGANVGHGHVFPRADGVKMRCGGPGLCSECAADAYRARAALAQPSPAHPAPVEQAGGDEREEFEAWMHTFDLPPQLDGETFADERYLEAACFGQFVYDDPLTQRCWAAWQARAALAQPSSAEARDYEEVRDRYDAAMAEVGRLRAIIRAFEGGYSYERLRSERDADNSRLHEVATACATAEQQRDAALAEVERLREENANLILACASLDSEKREMQHKWDAIIAMRDAALARVVELERQEPVATVAKVPGEDWNSLDFHRDLQDMQPGTKFYAAPVAQAQQLHDLDKQCRDDVARALGLRPNQERGFAWSYLLASIKSCVKASEDSAQAQHSVPELLVRAEDFVSGKEVPQAWLDVQAERRRQITAEGWTPEHDDLYCAAELPRAAAAYILNGANDEAPAIWPFSAKWWKPRDARSNYVRAGALILAEIERLDRAAPGKEGNDD
ncbi:hypothetical protein PCP85_18510 [Pseudomonas aeruginosa]|uniref:hypothetical protein n=1 Tax=Pseudomonas aeruginosa TaxID=287 RepID=UPI001F408B5D|nr:hypothetical protein [Pseudomonas aeruginosa]